MHVSASHPRPGVREGTWLTLPLGMDGAEVPRAVFVGKTKRVVRYSCDADVPVNKFPCDGIDAPSTGWVRPSHEMIGAAQMPSTPNEPGSVTQFTASGHSGFSCPSRGADPETTVLAAEEVSPPLAVISEHEVMLGTAAASAAARSFEGEDAAAQQAAAARRSGWIAMLTRLVTPSLDGRPPRRHYPLRLGFNEHARMAREMRRL